MKRVMVKRQRALFQECMQWLRFRRGHIVQVYDAEEAKIAHENGLETLLVEDDNKFLNESNEEIQSLIDNFVVPNEGVNADLVKRWIGSSSKKTRYLVFRVDSTNSRFDSLARIFESIYRQNQDNILVWIDVNDLSLTDFHFILTKLVSAFSNKLTMDRLILNSGFDQQSTSMISAIEFQPPDELIIGNYLKRMKMRIAVLEATTGGLVAASLLSVPGASSFFISGATVYTGRGAKRILPPDVLQSSALFDRQNNYANRENYVQSKRKYCQVVSESMRNAMKADFCIVESGTTGPDFYIPGVEAFTGVGVAGPDGFWVVDVFDSPLRDRRQNMEDFKQFALRTLRQALERYHDKHFVPTNAVASQSKI